jgi:hypothetical protein
VYVKGANLGFGLKGVPHRIVDLLVLFALIFLGTSRLFQKLKAKTRLDFPDETSTISSMKPRCFFRIGTALSLMVLASSCDFPDLLVIYNYACEHLLAPFLWLEGEGNPPRARQRKAYSCFKTLSYFCHSLESNAETWCSWQAVFRGGGAKCRAKGCFEKR